MGLFWYWRAADAIKQKAFLAVKRHCKEMDVQLLDDSLALRGFWLKRDAHNNLRWWRSYQFEFSTTGEERYKGLVVTLAGEVQTIQLQPHRLH